LCLARLLLGLHLLGDVGHGAHEAHNDTIVAQGL